MAFTTIPGAEYGADTAFIGTESVDTIAIVGLEGSAYLAGEADNDIVTVTNFTDLVSDYTLKGGQGNDSFTITANIAASFVAGNLGNDTISSVAYNVSGTTLQGGQGDDRITSTSSSFGFFAGNLGNDTITVDDLQSSSAWGGQGNDFIDVGGSIRNSSIQGNLGEDNIVVGFVTAFSNSTISGGDARDFIDASLQTNIEAGLTIDGDEGNDVLIGGSGNDLISGGEGADAISGGPGTDTLQGGAGNDTLTGGAGADTLIGGEGVNTFTDDAANTIALTVAGGIEAVDTITDWKSTDKVRYFEAGATPATIADGSVTGYATIQAAYDAFDGGAPARTMTTDYVITAVGSGNAWTAVLLIANGAGTAAAGAVQLGGTGIYGNTAFAMDAITTANLDTIA